MLTALYGANVSAYELGNMALQLDSDGQLNHKAWTDFHHISPLTGSLNPADYREQLAKVDQVHFVGEDDTVIPPFLANDFVANLPTSSHAKVIVMLGYTHGCCWQSTWQNVYERLD
jgi:pimeloyl-ACP methyl ester carboxylesterase